MWLSISLFLPSFLGGGGGGGQGKPLIATYNLGPSILGPRYNKAFYYEILKSLAGYGYILG